jgi:hypothetical protein
MVWHFYRQALKARSLDEVIVATDDDLASAASLTSRLS